MSKKSEIQEGSAAWHVIQDADLMEFLNNAGGILFEIPSDEREKYLSIGTATVEFEDVSEKKKIPEKTSLQNLHQKIKEKKKYLQELKIKEEKIQMEIGVLNKNISESINDIEDKTGKIKPNNDRVFEEKYLELSSGLKQFAVKRDKLIHIIDEISLRKKNIENEMSEMKEKQGLGIAVEKYDEDRRRRSMVLRVKYDELERTRIEESQKFRDSKNERKYLEKEIRKLRLEQDEYKRFIEQKRITDLTINKWKKEIESNKTSLKSIQRKIKIAETTLKKLKNQLKKISNIKIIK